jgi:mannose-1-phosphate guanylyltransferase
MDYKIKKIKLDPGRNHRPIQSNHRNYIVILAGGGGTRLWPKSRRSTPKQFLKLVDSKTLFQETVDRVAGPFPFSNIFVVTNKESVSEIKKEVPKLPPENILVEPAPKNTTAAAGLAAVYIAQKDPQAIISTLAADHYIGEKAKFLKVLSVAQAAAAKGNYIVTIGIHPTHAHTGLGYIHIGGEAFRVGETPVFEVREFKEKPDHTTAHAYFASGEYFWNANINAYQAKVLLAAIKKHFPSLSRALTKIEKGKNEKEVENAWQEFPPEPIDTAVLEKSKDVLVVPGDFSWFDVGDWATLHSILSSKPEWNVLLGEEEVEHLGFETEGCLIHGTGRLIATLGLKDLVIIDTPDVLLICPKSRSQEVKKLVEKLLVEEKVKYL